MGEIITVPKIGAGTEDDPIRPDTDATWWEKVTEDEVTMTIRIRPWFK